MTCTPPSPPWPELLASLRRYVRRRVADEHVAEDLVQDTLTKLTAQMQHAAPAGPLHAWLLRVAQNAIIDHYRRRGEPAVALDDRADDQHREPEIERAGLLASFRAFVQALPAEQREAVLRTEYEGVSQADLARELGVPLSTIKSRVQRGRARLHQALQECCAFEFDRRGRVLDWHRRPGGGCEDC